MTHPAPQPRLPAAHRPNRGRQGRRAFTLLEVLFVTIILIALVAILAVAIGAAMRSAREAAERQFINSLMFGVEQFKQQFDFLPLLVDDGDPVNTAQSRPNLLPNPPGNSVRQHNQLLRTPPTSIENEERFSEHSIPYYLVGVLDGEIDGVDGPGFTRPNRDDGSFARRGQRYEALIDLGRDPWRLDRTQPDPQHNVVLLDRWRTPIRYYRWLPQFDDDDLLARPADPDNPGPDDTAVPFAVGDPTEDSRLWSMQYAIISAGPSGVFGDEPIGVIRDALRSDDPDDKLRKRAREDNIVEVGR